MRLTGVLLSLSCHSWVTPADKYALTWEKLL